MRRELRATFAMLWVLGSGCAAQLGDPEAYGEEGSQPLVSRWSSPAGSDATSLLGFGARGTRAAITVCNEDATRSDHTGHDYGGGLGAPVYAIGAGVVSIRERGVIVIEHELTFDEQRALGLSAPIVYFAYWHVARAGGVVSGLEVEAGQLLGGMLDDGGSRHLHFEMRPSYPVDLSSITACRGAPAVGIGYVPDGSNVRYPTQFGYMHPTNTLATLQRVDAAEDEPAEDPPAEDPPADRRACTGRLVRRAA